MKTTCAGIAAAALLLAVSPSLASPVTYDVTATLDGGGTITGDFTVNGGNVTAFDFFLPTNLFPDPVASEINLSNAYVYYSPLPDFIVESYYYDTGNSTWYDTIFELEVDSLPTNSTPTSLTAGGLSQTLLFGSGNRDYLNFTQSGTISLDTPVSATPLPATLPLFAGGLGFVGYLTRRRKRGGKPASAVA
jgi:hypothetical protein